MIGIQGQKGSYHEEVARLLFSDETIDYSDTFSEVFDNLLSGRTEKAIVAIANNRYGFIPESYSEIIDHCQDIQITGEYYLSVRHQLMAMPGSRLEDIKTVYSQAVAIGQCHKFLEKNLKQAKVVEYTDTAASAKLVSVIGDISSAAIASKTAANVFGLLVISKDIQDDPDNITRFIVLEQKHKRALDGGDNKTTVILRTAQTAGSLANVLLLFKNFDINISSLHSSFIPNTEFEMEFFMEVDIGSTSKEFYLIRERAKEMNAEIAVVGSYRKFVNNKKEEKQ